MISLALSPILLGEETGKILFEDDFERSESQEAKEEIGEGWRTNSENRAKGNKQVDLKDGAMYINISPDADHAVAVIHDIGFEDGSVELRFMLENEKESIALDFADPSFKEVHAGHIFRITIQGGQVSIDDLKTGGANQKFAQKKKEKTLTPEDKKVIAGSKKTFPADLESGKWHSVLVTVKADQVDVSIDAKPIGGFSSPGFAHPKKRLLRLSVPGSAVVDDVKITDWK